MTARPRLEHVTQRIGPGEKLASPPPKPMLSRPALEAWFRERERVAPVSDVSGLDGYIAAIVIGPKFIDPRDWIGSIAGADALMAAEGTRDCLAIQAIVAHYNRVSQTLFDRPALYQPIFLTPPAGTVFWSLGFTEGVLLAKRAWRKVTHPDEPAHSLIEPMNKVLDQQDTPANAAEIVGKCVVDIRTYFNATRNR